MSSTSDEDDSVCTSSTMQRRSKRSRETGICIDALSELTDQLKSMDTDEMLCSSNEIVDWLSTTDEDVNTYPQRILFIENIRGTHITDILHNFEVWMALLNTMDLERQNRHESENIQKFARIKGNVDRCRQRVFKARECLQAHLSLYQQDTEDPDNSSESLGMHDDREGKDKDVQCLLKYLWVTCYQRQYRRLGDFLYQRRKGSTHVWEPVSDFATFIQKTLSPENDYPKWQMLTNAGPNRGQIEEQLRNGHVPTHLPELKRDRNVWAFSNGVYCAKDDMFYTEDEEWVDHEDIFPLKSLPSSIVPCKSFDKPFPVEHMNKKGDFYNGEWMDIPTPASDRIFNYQELENDVQRCIWSMGCGRMQYDMHDVPDQQKILFFVGMAGTGKSIWIDAVMHMYEDEDVGLVANKGSEGFALEGLESKYVWHISEVTAKFNMDQAQFQQIISGEGVKINRKNKHQIDHKWSAPGLMAGNETPNYSDNGGSIARRLMAVRFEKTLEKDAIDTTLKSQLRSEIGSMILKGNRAFRAMNSDFAESGQTFDKFAPVYFAESEAIMKSNTNALTHFLQSGELVFGDEHYMCAKKFQSQFQLHCEQNNLQKSKWTEEFYGAPFAQFNIKVPKNKDRGNEKLPCPRIVWEWNPNEGKRCPVPGQKVHKKFFHGCDLACDVRGEDADDHHVQMLRE